MCAQIGPKKILRDFSSAFFRLPGDAGSMLGVAPRRICFRPGLHIFCGLLRIGDLIPPDVVARSVVAASQGNCQKASGGKNEASHNFNQNSRERRQSLNAIRAQNCKRIAAFFSGLFPYGTMITARTPSRAAANAILWRGCRVWRQ
jgi:hypothetical protein